MKQGQRVNEKIQKSKKKMVKGDIEKKKKKIIKTFIAIIIIIVIGMIGYIANDFIILDKNKTTNLIINNTNVTGNLKKEIYIEGDDIYIAKQDLANFFDKYIYEEEEINKIITTYENKIAAIGFEENRIEINGSEVSTYAHAIKKDDTIYIPITELKDVYGIEINFIQDTDVVTIDSIAREQKKAIVNGNLAVKSSTNLIAKTIDRVKKGDYVIVISNDGKKAKVRTANGKIGYVKSKKLANTVVTRQSIEKKEQIEGKINLVWDYYSQVATAPDRTGTTMEGVNVVSPAFFHLNNKGKLEENIGEEGRAYINWAHKNGYKVWAMVQNAGSGMMNVTSNIMNHYKNRQELIEAIVEACMQYDLDGINIDFENMKKEDIDVFSRFIIELEPRLKEIGIVLSVDVTAPDGADTWSLCFDRTVLGDVADYLIFMGYDQYGASSDKAGTTAGYDWVELNLKKFLETYEVENNKLILAIPLYTRLWTVDSEGKVQGQTVVAMNKVDATIPSNIEKEWKEDLRQNYIEYQENGKTKKMWIEDKESLKQKLSFIKKYNLAGVASWEKGMETDDVWSIIKDSLKE